MAPCFSFQAHGIGARIRRLGGQIGRSHAVDRKGESQGGI